MIRPQNPKLAQIFGGLKKDVVGLTTWAPEETNSQFGAHPARGFQVVRAMPRAALPADVEV